MSTIKTVHVFLHVAAIADWAHEGAPVARVKVRRWWYNFSTRNGRKKIVEESARDAATQDALQYLAQCRGQRNWSRWRTETYYDETMKKKLAVIQWYIFWFVIRVTFVDAIRLFNTASFPSFPCLAVRFTSCSPPPVGLNVVPHRETPWRETWARASLGFTYF